MKKVRIAIAFILLALTVMGVGYARWSQSLPIGVSGTVARYRVLVSGAAAVLPPDFTGSPEDYLKVNDATFTAKSAAFKIKQLQYGEVREFTVSITNSGDIPATLTTVAVANRSAGPANAEDQQGDDSGNGQSGQDQQGDNQGDNQGDGKPSKDSPCGEGDKQDVLRVTVDGHSCVLGEGGSIALNRRIDPGQTVQLKVAIACEPGEGSDRKKAIPRVYRIGLTPQFQAQVR